MTRLRSFLPTLLAVLPLFFLVSACDSGGAGGEINNEFSFTITPTSSSSTAAVSSSAAQEDLNGYSFFVDTNDIEDIDNEEAFVIYFNNEDSFSQSNATSGLFGLVGRNSAQPGSGSYNLTDGQDGEVPDSDFVGVLYKDVESTQNTPFYVINSGTLDLEESNDNEVSGTITATATEFVVSSSGVSRQTVEITGTFTADDVDDYVPFADYANPGF